MPTQSPYPYEQPPPAPQTRQRPPTQIDLASIQTQWGIAPPPPGPTSPQHEKEAQRAMSHTDSWRPSREGRRPSYQKEDMKHVLQMSAVGVRDLKDDEPGFSERCRSPRT
ncbi:hypothetical protein F4779DRAFT_616009 [Xylariaceae sp. FL0662B]|nr:hypothetical protein F4779DRAFT_616009 [Xylariaceae sp. FL0662B]